eukprot:403357394
MKTCVPSCKQDQVVGQTRKIVIKDDQETQLLLNYCRGSKIYIDPDSRDYLELGTKTYPYKQIQPAIKEIFENLPSAQFQSFEILIKQNSTLFFNSRLEHHYFDGLYNLTIRTYQDANYNIELLGQRSKIFISASNKYYQHKSTYFSLMDASPQNLTESYHPQISSEKELRSVTSTSQPYFIVSRSNLTFQNLDIINEHTIFNEDDQFLYGIDIQYGTIILDRITFDFAGSIFQTKDNLNFQLTNTIIRTEYLNYAIALLTDCSLRKSYATYGDILIQNTTIKGNRIFEQKMPLIWLATNHNVTFNNNTINTYTLNSDANLIHFILSSVDNCIVPVNDGRVKIQKFTNLLVDQETKERNIQNLYQVIFSKGGDKQRDMIYQVENITVQNLFTTNNLFQFATPLPNITISNIKFINSTLKLKAGAFLNISSTTNIFLNRKGATFPQKASYLKITNFLIRNITFDEQSDGQMIIKMSNTQNAVIEMQNATFEDNKYFANNAIQFDRPNNVFIYNSQFKNELNITIRNSLVEKQNGLIVIDQFYNKLNTQIRIINSTFTDNNFVAGGPYIDGMIQVQTNSLLNVTDSIFEENFSISRGSVLFGDYEKVKIYINNCTFNNNYAFKGGVFYMEYDGFLQIENSKISNNFAIYGGMGIVTNQAYVVIKNSSIFNNFAIDSSIIEINDAVDNFSIFSDLEIEGNKLIQINDLINGSILSVNVSFLNMQNSFFNMTTVQILNSSSPRIDQSYIQIDSSSINIQNFSFREIHSEIGPLIKVQRSPERCDYLIENSKFQENYAIDQGGAINYIKNTPRGLDSNTYIDNYAFYGKNIASIPFTIRIVSLSKNDTISGKKFNATLVVEVLDVQGQRIVNDNTTNLKIAAIDEQNTAVQGQTMAKVKYGIVEFKDLTFIGRPQSQNVQFKVYSNTINNDHLRQIYNLSSETIINEDIFSINFRICLQGEVELNSQCYPCEQGTYSLQIGQNECYICPKNSECLGGTQISVNQGFWRSSFNQTQIHKCLYSKACIGGLIQTINEDADIQCATGYSGNLCQTCKNYGDVQYSRSAANKQWPDDLSEFFGVFTYVGDSVQNLIYFDCFLKNTTFSDNGQSITYFKTILIGVIPIMLLIVFGLGLYVCKLIKRTSKKVFIEWTIIMTVIVIYFTHPTVTRTIINIFYCLEIDSGQYWLQSDLSVKCWEGDHKSLSLVIGLPFLLFYVICLPILTFIYLYKKRKLIFTEEYKNKFKTLCSGLKPEFYYWEFVNIFRKTFLVSLNVFLQTEISIFKAMLSLLVLGIIYRLQVRLQPYEKQAINELEKREMLTNLITFYGSLFFVNDEIQSWVKAIAFLLIIGFNIWFIIKDSDMGTEQAEGTQSKINISPIQQLLNHKQETKNQLELNRRKFDPHDVVNIFRQKSKQPKKLNNINKNKLQKSSSSQFESSKKQREFYKSPAFRQQTIKLESELIVQEIDKSKDDVDMDSMISKRSGKYDTAIKRSKQKPRTQSQFQDEDSYTQRMFKSHVTEELLLSQRKNSQQKQNN